MLERELKAAIEDVREGRVGRRAFIARMASLGVGAPAAAQLLMHAGIAQAQTPYVYKPTRRGGGGALKILMWQGPTLLNPHFATGAKDIDGARIFYEPLAGWDGDGNLVPILAAEIPTRANGGVAADGRSVTWKLKRGVTWHDGQPFTADDPVFTWQYVRDPAAAAISRTIYDDMKVEKVDSHTIRITFDKPTPFWATPFVGGNGMVLPRHVFAAYGGAKSRDAPANLRPVGTGPYKIVDFKPGDLITGVLNPNYHMPSRPYFDTIEVKGGGDPTSAARAVIQVGEYDHAWNLQVEDEILKRLEESGKGRAIFTPAGDIEFIFLNLTDPWTDVDGERSNPRTRHFAFSDPAVRQAMALLIDRKSMEQYIYGRAGVATANWINEPARYRSPNTKWAFDPERAAQMLDAAGWKRAGGGLREKDGRKMKFVFQSSVNSTRQKAQAIIKSACQKIGIELELKAITASVFFSSDVANPDTNTKFIADFQMYGAVGSSPDPLLGLARFVSWEIVSKANKWQGRNISRWRSDDYDRLYRQAENEMDPVKRTAMCIRMNDIVVNDGVVIPLINRRRVYAKANKLVSPLSGFDTDFWAIQDWFKDV